MTSPDEKARDKKAGDTEDGAGNERVVRIVAGVHAGASRALGTQEMMLVGSGDDCDIVLSDAGVARHHAMLNLSGGVASLRALDAQLQLDGRPVYPGDPVAVEPLQRIELGVAAIAFGDKEAEGWDIFLPGGERAGENARGSRGRLPIIAALAVGLLGVATVFAMTTPMHKRASDPQAQLTELNRSFGIEAGRIEPGIDGMKVLRGTVRDDATIARIRQHVEAEGMALELRLRSGQQIAEDAREVLRASPQPIRAQAARYIGHGKVEITGHFEDRDALQAAIHSRSMQDTGIKQVLVRNLADPAPSRKGPAGAGSQQEEVRIVQVVRGKNAHLVARDGTRYATGEQLPGIGKLVAIGEVGHAISSDGMVHQVPVRPVTAEELAAEEEAQAAGEPAGKPAAARTAKSETPKPDAGRQAEAKPAVAKKASAAGRTTRM